MDTIFIQIHITRQEKIFLLIIIRDYKWQPLTARLRTGETESPTSILHHSDSKLTNKGKLGKNTTVLQGTKGCRLKHKFWQQWTIVLLLSKLSYAFNVPRGSLYSSSKGYWRVESVRSQGIWKARSHMSLIQDKERSNSFGLCTHPDVHDYRRNIRVCTRLSGKRPHISFL